MEQREEYVMRLTSKGQVTIPAAIRKRLGIKPGEQVAFVVERGEVKLRPVSATLDAVFDMVEPLARPEDLARVIEIAHEEQAQQAAARNS